LKVYKIKWPTEDQQEDKLWHIRREVHRFHSNPVGWCIAVLSIWRECSSGSILLWQV